MSDKLEAKVRLKRILYPKGDFVPGSFAIAVCDVAEVKSGESYSTDSIVIKGKLFSLNYGIDYNLVGEYTEDKYGQSYKVITMEQDHEITADDEKAGYLKAILTEYQFDLVQDKATQVFDLLKSKNVPALTAIKGIGSFKAAAMIQRFEDSYEKARGLNILCNQYGMSTEAASNLIRKYPSTDALLAMIEKNPYIMITQVDGIGWSKADEIAKKTGMAQTDARRAEACVVHLFKKWSEEGHTWSTPQCLWDNFSSIIFEGCNVTPEDQTVLRTAMNSLHSKGILWWSEDKSKVGLQYLHNLEANIADELHRIMKAPLLKPDKDASSAIKEMEESQGWDFTQEQMNAIQKAVDNNVTIITGAAGTGKSAAVAALLKLLSGHSFAQCALSGRAAARLTEVTGSPGQTIHRLLGFTNGTFSYNEENTLPYDIIILDEISMVGAEIFLLLLRAIPSGAKLIMLGDDGQLESIGLCNIFRDMLDSKVIPVGRLTKIHRQAAKSAIITESMKVRNEQALCPESWIGEETRGDLQDLKLKVYGERINTPDFIFEEYKKLIEQGISKHKIQVVVPMKKRGEYCTKKMNAVIQQYVNAHNVKNSITIGQGDSAYTLRLDDRVICTKNLYDAERAYAVDPSTCENEKCPVYNGDRGVVKAITSNGIIIKFDLWGDILIRRDKLFNIELGYALSCHKLQGSEADYVIVGFDLSSMVLLTKEWLYTAITRAKKYCVVVAESKALKKCISTSHVPNKCTQLSGILKQTFMNEEGAT